MISHFRILVCTLILTTASFGSEINKASSYLKANPDNPYIDTIITVTTTEEFVNAIGSNRTIYLEAEQFAFNSILGNSAIEGVSYLRISGSDELMTKIYQGDPSYHVLSFVNCHHIILTGLRMDHMPDSRQVVANTLNFDHCSDIRISESFIPGNNQIGIYGTYVKNMLCKDLRIFRCGLHHVKFENSKNIHIEDSRFGDSHLNYSASYFNACTQVTFEDCLFENIEVGEIEGHSHNLLDFIESTDVLIDECIFKKNKANSLFGSAADKIVFQYCTIEGNEFLN